MVSSHGERPQTHQPKELANQPEAQQAVSTDPCPDKTQPASQTRTIQPSTQSKASNTCCQQDIQPIEALFTINAESAISGRNTLAEAWTTTTFFPKPVFIKIYSPQGHSRAIHEQNMLHCLSSPEGGTYAVECKSFHDRVLYNDKICSVLAMEQGGNNLQQLVESLSPGKALAYAVPTMKKIAKSLHFLHAAKRVVHGEVSLANVVVFDQGMPDWKLIDFENSCVMNECMDFDVESIDAEYCPPEVAELLQNQSTVSIVASGSLDVYCFGVLWMKYLTKGGVLTEFVGMSKSQILDRICQPGFNFERTLNQLPIHQPTRNLIRACTYRDPKDRPSFHEILTNHVIKGYDTLLMNIRRENTPLGQTFLRLQTLMNELISNTTMIQQLDKRTLPCVWVLIPWEDTRGAKAKRKQWPWTIHWHQDMELRMLCEAFFNDPNSTSACAPCSDRDRIRVKGSDRLVKKFLGLLRCSAAVLRITKLAAHVRGIELSDVFPCEDLLKAAEFVLEEFHDEDKTLQVILDSVKETEAAQTASPFTPEEDQQNMATLLNAHSQTIRALFQSAEKQQLMYSILQEVKPDKSWTNDKIIGGLEKINDKSGNILWVCSKHAKRLQASSSFD